MSQWGRPLGESSDPGSAYSGQNVWGNDLGVGNYNGAYQNNVIVLHGQRRTGKTSILYRLQEVMAGTHVGVLVDMQRDNRRFYPE